MRKKAVFLEGAYAGIGDCMYLTCSLAEIAKDYENIILINSVPWLFSAIPEVKVLDPFSDLQICRDHLRKHMAFGDDFRDIPPHLTALNHDRKSKQLYASPEEVVAICDGYIDQVDSMLCMTDGSGLLPQNHYQAMMVYEMFEKISNDSEMHPMILPAEIPEGFYELGRHLMSRAGIADPSRTILTHSFWRYVGENPSKFPGRVGRDEDYLYFTNMLKRKTGFDFFDVEYFITGMESLTPQTPAFHVNGMDGLLLTLALVDMCAGVVLQNACRLLPVAQSLNKPCVMFNQGGCSASVFNWHKLGIDPFILLEPENIHQCYRQSGCEECLAGRITKESMDNALDLFVNRIKCVP